MDKSLSEPLAYDSGRIIPLSQLSVAPQDLGFMWGVTLAEQMRTFGGEIFEWSAHLNRLQRGLEILGWADQIKWSHGERRGERHSEQPDEQQDERHSERSSSPELLFEAAEQIVAHHLQLLKPGDDVGLTLFVTPGLASTYTGGSATSFRTVMHTYPLPFRLWAKKYRDGQACLFSSYRQIGEQSWPRELKCRSRAHYYLADQEARAKDPHARAIVLDEAGKINEASTANVIVYRRDEGIVSPPIESILPGITLQVVERLARAMSIPFIQRPLSVDETLKADEVLLTSTPFGILPVRSIEQISFPAGNGTIYQQMLVAWRRETGIDLVRQADAFCDRES